MLIIFVFLYYFGFAASVLLTGRFNSGVQPHLSRTSRRKFVVNRLTTEDTESTESADIKLAITLPIFLAAMILHPWSI
jgi:hypothetical protein